MKRFTLLMVFAIVASVGAIAPEKVSAQEILLEGPLAGAPAVRKLVQYRKLRFSAGPQFSYTLNNQYVHNFLVGLRLEFNFTDWFGFGLTGFYSFNANTKLTKHISASRDIGGDPTTPTDSNWPSYTGSDNFENQVALLKGMYMGHLNFVPFRGKMSLFEKLFVSVDGAIFLGGGVVHFQERKECAKGQCGNISQPGAELSRESQIAGTFTAGLNFNAYVNDFVAVNVEFRATPFRWNAGGTDESGQSAAEWRLNNDQWNYVSSGDGDYPDGAINKEDRKWNPNMTIGLGVTIILPTKPSVSE